MTIYLPLGQICITWFQYLEWHHKNLLSIPENCQYFVQDSGRTKSFQCCTHHPILVNFAVNCPGIKGPRKMLYYSNCLKTSEHWLSRTGLLSSEFPIRQKNRMLHTFQYLPIPKKKKINESNHLGISTTLMVQFSLEEHQCSVSNFKLHGFSFSVPASLLPSSPQPKPLYYQSCHAE